MSSFLPTAFCAVTTASWKSPFAAFAGRVRVIDAALPTVWLERSPAAESPAPIEPLFAATLRSFAVPFPSPTRMPGPLVAPLRFEAPPGPPAMADEAAAPVRFRFEAGPPPMPAPFVAPVWLPEPGPPARPLPLLA